MKKQKSIALHIKNCDKKDPENLFKNSTPPLFFQKCYKSINESCMHSLRLTVCDPILKNQLYILTNDGYLFINVLTYLIFF